MNVDIVINPIFKNLIPALTSEEYKNLETSLINDGCKDAVVLWNSTIVDGHNRYEICTKHNIEFKTVQKDFENEEDAKEWIINNQLVRHNLSDYDRSRLAVMLEGIHKGEAKASDVIKQQLVSGETSINQAYKTLHKPHVTYNSGENEWYTPENITDAARLTMGTIDLDPASSEIANQTINATEIYTIEDDGLNKHWYGNVWLNPPYSRPKMNHFSIKLTQELPNICQACVLINNATETKWCQRLLKKCSAICFISGRVSFKNGHGVASSSPLQGQLILYFGKNVDGFLTHFEKLGICTPVQIRVSSEGEDCDSCRIN